MPSGRGNCGDHAIDCAGVGDLPPTFVPPVMLVRQARGQVRQARGPQAPAAVMRCARPTRPLTSLGRQSSTHSYRQPNYHLRLDDALLLYHWPTFMEFLTGDYEATGEAAANRFPLPSISSIDRTCAPERSETYRMSETPWGISDGREGTTSTW